MGPPSHRLTGFIDSSHQVDLVSRHLLLISDDASDAAIVEKALLDAMDETLEVEWVRTCAARACPTRRTTCISARASPCHGRKSNSDKLMKNADFATYYAKSSGRKLL
jgi:hypothetical protein